MLKCLGSSWCLGLWEQTWNWVHWGRPSTWVCTVGLHQSKVYMDQTSARDQLGETSICACGGWSNTGMGQGLDFAVASMVLGIAQSLWPQVSAYYLGCGVNKTCEELGSTGARPWGWETMGAGLELGFMELVCSLHPPGPAWGWGGVDTWTVVSQPGNGPYWEPGSRMLTGSHRNHPQELQETVSAGTCQEPGAMGAAESHGS